MIDCNILKSAVLFRLKTSCKWGNTAKVPLNEQAVLEIIGPPPETMTQEEAEDRLAKAMKRLKGGQKLLVSPEYDAAKKYMSDTKKRILTMYCNPSFIDDGLYTVKLDKVAAVVNELNQAREYLRNILAVAFQSALPEQIEAAKPVLGEVFAEKNYPTTGQVLGLFDISWRIIQMDVPEGLPPEVRAAEEAKLKEAFKNAESKITAALYAEFQTFLAHIVDRLTPGENGAKKKFNHDLLGGLSEFMGAFNNRNMLNDSKLAALVKQAEEIVTNASNGKTIEEIGKELKSDDQLREGMKQALDGLKGEVDKAISELPVRALDLSEESETEAA